MTMEMTGVSCYIFADGVVGVTCASRSDCGWIHFPWDWKRNMEEGN